MKESKRMNSISPRPDFEGPPQYVDHVADCIASGYEAFAPATIAELHAVLEAFPDFARRWLPPFDECERLGIDHTIGQPVEPLSDREFERLLLKLHTDPDARLALNTVLMGRTAA
jgi:hypothetical protein